MTGAPKKRSVELLQDIEGRERGVYSGVCGYWCVSGGGDWAVIIRSCFRYDDANVEVHDVDSHVYLNGDGRGHQKANSPFGNKDVHIDGGAHEQEWTLGAGGAITALSDPDAEWEEMLVKVGSVRMAFGVDEL